MPRRRQMRTAAVVPRAPLGNFPPGKIDPDLRNSETPSVATYVRDINGNWQRCVDAFINVARICAEANTRLTVAEKSELMPSLPFGEATFSKFARIGTDTRLQAPDIQRLLPAHYTTVYHISQLTDEELKQAIAENVIHPNMKRAELQKWHRQLSRKANTLQSPRRGRAVLPWSASLPRQKTLSRVAGFPPPRGTITGTRRTNAPPIPSTRRRREPSRPAQKLRVR